MTTQSSKKRTFISFSLALATALMTLYIQDTRNQTDQQGLNIAAKLYPISKAFIQ